MGKVQAVDVEELDDWFPQQMGTSEGHFHAHSLQRHCDPDEVFRET